MLLVITTLFFFVIIKIFIFEIPVRRKMLNDYPATNILIIKSWGKTKESYQPLLKVELSPSHCSHVILFSLSLVEERGQVLSNGNWSVDPGRLMDEQLLWWLNTFLRIKELKGTKNCHEWDVIKKAIMKTWGVLFSSDWFF